MALTLTALTTLAKVKTALRITVSTYDTQLEDAINVASEMISGYLTGQRSGLHYLEDIEETVPGHGTTEITVSRLPCWAVVSIAQSGSVIDASDYALQTADDKRAGVITSQGGWRWQPMVDGGGISRRAVVGHDLADIVVTYDGGWVTPAQSLPSPNTNSVETLPAVIDMACVRTACWLYGRAGSDPTVQSESLMSYSVSYGSAADQVDPGSGLPLAVAAMLGPYRMLVQT